MYLSVKKKNMKTVIPSEITSVQLQTIMQTAVSPRPIALASTVDKDGKAIYLHSVFSICSVRFLPF
jgi:hypothetical protein